VSTRRCQARAIGLLLVLSTLGVACGGSSEGSGGGTPIATGSPLGSGSGAGATGSPGLVGGPSGQVQIHQGVGGLVFSPSKLTVRRGTQLVVANPGVIQHTFTVPGQDIDVVNDPGQFQTVAITIPPGRYTFVCRFHQAQGMTGTLTVTG
jgi:plastocyanin